MGTGGPPGGGYGLIVRDLKSLNGIFLKIAHEERLDSGDVFRIGQELLRLEVRRSFPSAFCSFGEPGA